MYIESFQEVLREGGNHIPFPYSLKTSCIKPLEVLAPIQLKPLHLTSSTLQSNLMIVSHVRPHAP